MPLLNIDWTQDNRNPRAFLDYWSESVAAALTARLPSDRFAVEAMSAAPPSVSAHGVAAPPTLTAPARFTDAAWVCVSASDIVAAVMFVTPDNKADSDASLAFAVRVAGMLGSGASVVVVDALPGPASWATHLHSLVGVYPLARRPRGTDAPVLVVAPGPDGFAVWHHAVAAGFPLPTVPVAVRGAMHLRLDLEATYAEACAAGRIS